MTAAKLRVVIGFFVSPGVPALFLYLIGLIFYSSWEAAWGPNILAICGYLAAFIIGVPMYFILKRKNISSLKAYLILGALVGFIFYVVFFGLWVLLSWQKFPEHALLILKGSVRSGIIAVVYATVASAIFWLISIKKFGND
ncbi:hypothetical protein [Chitinimonas sp. BJB300]|uniref:hypothetical protein n=1 Tax=Chitinimonas sp. BJB300 TaxID=1559339 RepID=UPI000C0F15C4|nr:hypothetical protein [Chitinimonas sp. BJB300]PHV09707.1 hypothetical protein CSQ89_20230 [Chitinimonas sp. BJB300]TSJ83236.1 hypothetical protein FG002_021520 [Chitinimonas sp. BJB300]